MNDNKSSQGLGVLGVLQIIFIVLKLVGVINWSWLLVLIPVWVVIGLLILGVIIALFVKAYMDQYK